MDNTGFLILVVVGIALLALWIGGLIKLYQKNQMVLFWIAIAGIIVPFIGLVAYAGYFVEDQSSVV